MQRFLGWLLILFFALLLLIMGVQGSLGRVVAVAFTPASLNIAQGA